VGLGGAARRGALLGVTEEKPGVWLARDGVRRAFDLVLDPLDGACAGRLFSDGPAQRTTSHLSFSCRSRWAVCGVLAYGARYLRCTAVRKCCICGCRGRAGILSSSLCFFVFVLFFSLLSLLVTGVRVPGLCKWNGGKLGNSHFCFSVRVRVANEGCSFCVLNSGCKQEGLGGNGRRATKKFTGYACPGMLFSSSRPSLAGTAARAGRRPGRRDGACN
jgi:hypothetical protein